MTTIVEAGSEPTAESNVYAPFRSMQYTHDMLGGRAKLDALDDDRHADTTRTRVMDLLRARAREQDDQLAKQPLS